MNDFFNIDKKYFWEDNSYWGLNFMYFRIGIQKLKLIDDIKRLNKIFEEFTYPYYGKLNKFLSPYDRIMDFNEKIKFNLCLNLVNIILKKKIELIYSKYGNIYDKSNSDLYKLINNENDRILVNEIIHFMNKITLFKNNK